MDGEIDSILAIVSVIAACINLKDLSKFDDLGIDWVIISQGSHSYLDDSWIEQNSDTEYSVFKKATTV